MAFCHTEVIVLANHREAKWSRDIEEPSQKRFYRLGYYH